MRRLFLVILFVMPILAEDLHYISMHGQSLCLGTLGSPRLSATQPYNNKRLISSGAAVEPLTEGNTAATGFDNAESPASGMANQLTFLSSGLTWNSLIDNNDCIGGAAYSVLKKGTAPYTAWLTAMHAASTTVAGLGSTFSYKGAIVIHGETDFNNGVTAAAYAADLAEWRSNIASDVSAAYGPNAAPMLVSQMSTWSAYNASQPLLCSYAACNGIQERGVPLGQLDAARNNNGIYFLGPKYQYPYADSLHLTNQGYLQLGELAGKVWKSLLIDHVYWTGLVPRSITSSGATLTFQAWVPAGSLTIDTTTLADATYCQGVSTADPAACTSGGGVWVYKGFEFYDSSGTAKAYITGAAITASNTIAITLNKIPTGSNQRLRYAFTGAGKFPGGAATAPHGNIRDSDTAVGVTSGARLYNWLATFDDPVGFSWAPPSRGLFPLPSPRRQP